MEKIKGFIFSIVMLFTFSLSMNARVNDYEQFGWVLLDRNKTSFPCNGCYYLSDKSENVFGIQFHGARMDGVGDILLLTFDDGSVIKLYRRDAVIKKYYHPEYKKIVYCSTFYYNLNDEAIYMLRFNNLVKINVELDNLDYKEINLSSNGGDVKEWFNNCFIKTYQKVVTLK